MEKTAISAKSTDTIQSLFEAVGITVDKETCEKFKVYLLLLKKWNLRINLTASSDWRRIAPMLQEGAWASKFYPPDAISHLDIGSGAGFPIVPIKILIPNIQLDLVESRIKRAVFLETVAARLGLSATRVHAMRLDQYIKKCECFWDCVSWKGLRLGATDVRELREHSHKHTQVLMFHGRDLALEDTESMNREFRLIRREQFPTYKGWMLSIYVPA